MTAPTEEIRPFYNADAAQALEDCQDPQERYQAQFMPQLADRRINGTLPWNQFFSTPSINTTGRTRQGNAVVVYAHIPNWLANPANIRAVKAQGLVKGAGRLPQNKFQQLVDADEQTDVEGNRLVWVIDYDILKKSTSGRSGRIAIANALEHPQTIPFLGGQVRAQRYLREHAQVYNTEIIGVWHNDDLNKDSPLARLLYLGYDKYVSIGGGGLVGNINLDSVGQFVGVRSITLRNTQTLEESIESIGNRHIRELMQVMRQRGDKQ